MRLVRALKVEAYLDKIEISACGLSLRLEELSAVVRRLTKLHKVLFRKMVMLGCHLRVCYLLQTGQTPPEPIDCRVLSKRRSWAGR